MAPRGIPSDPIPSTLPPGADFHGTLPSHLSVYARSLLIVWTCQVACSLAGEMSFDRGITFHAHPGPVCKGFQWKPATISQVLQLPETEPSGLRSPVELS